MHTSNMYKVLYPIQWNDRTVEAVMKWLFLYASMYFITGLVNGSNQFEGRIEVFIQGQWGTVCEDAWNLADAVVACRQLGYGHPYDITRRWLSPYFGPNYNIPILLDNMFCRATENRLQDCPALVGNTSHNCRHIQDAGVICTDVSKSKHFYPLYNCSLQYAQD